MNAMIYAIYNTVCLVTPKILPGEFYTFHDALVPLVGLVYLPKLGAIPFSAPIWQFQELVQLHPSPLT